VWLASLLVAAFAICHGYAHGTEIPSLADPIGYSTGFMLATGSLHLAGISIGMLNDFPGGKVVTRSVGVLIAFRAVFDRYESRRDSFVA
jgi:urease accessory protein